MTATNTQCLSGPTQSSREEKGRLAKMSCSRKKNRVFQTATLFFLWRSVFSGTVCKNVVCSAPLRAFGSWGQTAFLPKRQTEGGRDSGPGLQRCRSRWHTVKIGKAIVEREREGKKKCRRPRRDAPKRRTQTGIVSPLTIKHRRVPKRLVKRASCKSGEKEKVVRGLESLCSTRLDRGRQAGRPTNNNRRPTDGQRAGQHEVATCTKRATRRKKKKKGGAREKKKDLPMASVRWFSFADSCFFSFSLSKSTSTAARRHCAVQKKKKGRVRKNRHLHTGRRQCGKKGKKREREKERVLPPH